VNAAQSDEDLLRRSLDGDAAAFGLLIERHQDRVYRVCLRIVGNAEDARDAAQDAFLTAFRKLAQFRGDAAFATWLHRIAVNSCYDSLRRKKRRPLLHPIRAEDEAPFELGPPVADHAEEVAGTLDVGRALSEIREDHRIVLVLADVEDMAYEEIAAILDVPIGTVKSRVHRGRVALAEALGIGPDATRSRHASEPTTGSGTSEEAP
jgi:RNA polymerase sigma-70 factor (ECF subfamily)